MMTLSSTIMSSRLCAEMTALVVDRNAYLARHRVSAGDQLLFQGKQIQVLQKSETRVVVDLMERADDGAREASPREAWSCGTVIKLAAVTIIICFPISANPLNPRDPRVQRSERSGVRRMARMARSVDDAEGVMLTEESATID